MTPRVHASVTPRVHVSVSPRVHVSATPRVHAPRQLDTEVDPEDASSGSAAFGVHLRRAWMGYWHVRTNVLILSQPQSVKCVFTYALTLFKPKKDKNQFWKQNLSPFLRSGHVAI